VQADEKAKHETACADAYLVHTMHRGDTQRSTLLVLEQNGGSIQIIIKVANTSREKWHHINKLAQNQQDLKTNSVKAKLAIGKHKASRVMSNLHEADNID
jgi:hypothetical protein